MSEEELGGFLSFLLEEEAEEQHVCALCERTIRPGEAHRARQDGGTEHVRCPVVS